MKKVICLSLIFISQQAFSAPVWTNAKVKMVFAGYSDNSVSFVPVGQGQNPAGCTISSAYVIQSDHDSKGALSILLAAKMADKTVHFSVRDDVCHTVQQTDVNGMTVPVIQRIGVE